MRRGLSVDKKMRRARDWQLGFTVSYGPHYGLHNAQLGREPKLYQSMYRKIHGFRARLVSNALPWTTSKDKSPHVAQ